MSKVFKLPFYWLHNVTGSSATLRFAWTICKNHCQLYIKKCSAFFSGGVSLLVANNKAQTKCGIFKDVGEKYNSYKIAAVWIYTRKV